MIESPVIDFIKEKGKREGEKKGIVKGKLEDARKMLERQMSLKDILDITGLKKKDLVNAGIISGKKPKS